MKLITMAAVCGGLLLTSGAVMAADEKPASGQATRNAEALPKGATLISPGTYTYTDAQGKKWIYRQTPFGVAKFEDIQRPATDQEGEKKRIEQTRAFDDGDSVRFERPGPFGLYRWKQKKTDLNAMEQAVWDREHGRKSSSKE
jgi:hypothetical protein